MQLHLFFQSEPLFFSPAALFAFLFLIMWQFQYPVSLWPNKSGVTPIIKHLCQENCVNQMLRAGNSCPKTNIMEVGEKILLLYHNPAGCLHAHQSAVARPWFTRSHTQLYGIPQHHQHYSSKHNDLSSWRLDCWLFCRRSLLNLIYTNLTYRVELTGR